MTGERDEFGDLIPDFGPPIFRATEKAISVKLSNDEWVSATRYQNIVLYLDEDGKIVQAVIVLQEDDEEEDTGDSPV